MEKLGFSKQAQRFFLETLGFPKTKLGFPKEAQGFPKEKLGFPKNKLCFPTEIRGLGRPSIY